MKRVLILYLLFLPVFCFSQSAGEVVKIITSNTYKVKTGTGKRLTITLYGVACPKENQPYGNKVNTAVKQQLKGKNVKLDLVDTANNGNIVAKTYLRKTMVNEWLIRNGFAWVNNQKCNQSICDKWNKLQDSKRKDKVGIWSQKNPVPPWEYQKGDDKNKTALSEDDKYKAEATDKYSAKELEQKESLDKNFPKINKNLDKAALHLDKYKKQVNTGEALKIAGAVVSSIVFGVTESGSNVRNIAFGGGIGLSLSGFIVDITAESHLENVSKNLRRGSKLND